MIVSCNGDAGTLPLGVSVTVCPDGSYVAEISFTALPVWAWDFFALTTVAS